MSIQLSTLLFIPPPLHSADGVGKGTLDTGLGGPIPVPTSSPNRRGDPTQVGRGAPRGLRMVKEQDSRYHRSRRPSHLASYYTGRMLLYVLVKKSHGCFPSSKGFYTYWQLTYM
jgi:hypothetical protein